MPSKQLVKLVNDNKDLFRMIRDVFEPGAVYVWDPAIPEYRQNDPNARGWIKLTKKRGAK